MDILLTHGYFLFDDPAEQKVMKPYPPLGLLYLSAYLKQQGAGVEVFDSTFSNLAAFSARLAERRPPVIGIYANLMTKFNVLKMMGIARAQGCRVIVGGPDPPYYAEEYLRHGADVVVIGEGEETLAELLPALAAGKRAKLAGIDGIAFLDDDGIFQRTPPRALFADLDRLPLPDRQAIDVASYVDTWRRHHGTGAVSLITARGCPYQCTWCSHSVYGNSLRKRAPRLVVDEVEMLLQTYRPDMLWYADDVFNIHRKWFYAYAAELKKRQINLPFECICRADRLDEDMIRGLRAMGCVRLWLGSESGSQRLLDAMRRGVTATRVQAMTRLAKRHGIETGMFLMWGYEDENEQDIAETIAHVKKANPDLVLTTVSYPIKGTEYYRRMQAQNALVADRPWAQTNDRQYKIRGRHSRRYYDFANKWLYNDLALTKMRENGRFHALRACRAIWQKNLGRLGMRLTRRQREA